MSNTQFNLTPENLPVRAEENGHYYAVDEAQIVPQQEIPLSVEAVTLAERMGRIQAKLDAEMTTMENAGRAIAQVVNSITPTDQASYTELCERLTDNKIFLDKVEEFIEPWKKLFYRPYQAVLERSKIINAAPMQSHTAGRQRIIEFDRRMKAAADAETLRLKKEQADREAEQRLNSAVAAESMGLSEQAVETILTQPSVTPTPVVTSQISRPIGFRKIPPNWQAEIASKEDFWKWARTQKEMPACLLIDFPVLNREAKTHKATLGQKYPGLRGVNKGGE